MSNRLEELSAKCKKYYFKNLLKKFLLLVLLLSLPFSAYYIYFFTNPELTQTALILTPNPILEAKEYKPAVVQKSPLVLQPRIIKTPTINVPAQKKTIVKQEVETTKENYFADSKEEQPIEDWIEKYNQKKSYYPAIYIGKHYFKEKNYKQAGIWAKRANQLDRDKEEAWLYYAKSVYALDNIEKARRILTIYLQYKESPKAEILLSEWTKQ